MSRHRSRPAHQRVSRWRSAVTGPRSRKLGEAMRRVVMTPTFAAGLGVVIAAMMAYPVTRTVIRFGGPDTGQQCQAPGCATGGVGRLASAAPGRRLVTPSPAPSPASTRHRGHRHRHRWHGHGHRRGPRDPRMSYQTLHHRRAFFTGAVTISGVAGAEPGRWSLRLSFRGARVRWMRGGTWHPDGPHAVVIRGWQAGGPGSGGHEIRVVFSAHGRPGPPSGCEFDGRPCRAA